jgi:hypothetical protein
MPLINLFDIQQIHRTRQQPLFPHQKYNQNHSTFDSIIANNFHMVMKQLFLQLPVEPLLYAHPEIAQWIAQLQELAPEIFPTYKKLLVDTLIVAPMTTDSDSNFIEVFTNIGFKQGVPKIYEWGIRHPRLSWQDRVKLWAATVKYSISPNKIHLVILALDLVKPPQRLNIRWNKKLHQQTEKWLIKLLTKPHEDNLESNLINNTSSMINLNAVAEVQI